MINLKVDESYAFDYLSILEVKKNKTNSGIENWSFCFNFLKNQIEENLFNQIINSNEYKDMINANLNTFDAVEKARYGLISAKEVDDWNMKRYEAKVKFQNKFFPSKKITEIKT